MRRGVSALLAVLALAGCGRVGEEKSGARLTLLLPCVLSGPLQKVAAAYQDSYPQVRVTTQIEKPLPLLSRALASSQAPAVVITAGEVEMNYLAQAGAVGQGQVRAFAVNTFPLTVIAPSQAKQPLGSLRDLARAQRVFLEDPSRSTLGARAEQAFRRLGLWEEIAPKIVALDPEAMVLSELAAGKADAAVVFRDCLFAEGGSGGSPPRTIRIIADLPQDSYPPIHYQAAPLKAAPPSPAAPDFVAFLTSPEGIAALKAAGLAPAARPSKPSEK